MEHFTIELRQRIQSCNVFILLQSLTEARRVQIRLRNNSILLIIHNNQFSIGLPNVSIVPESLSLLNVIDKWITFRVQSHPSDSMFGTFTTEFLSIKDESNSSSDISHDQLPPKGTDLFLTCQCCNNILTKTGIKFQRVLPLPSDDCDPCEWFCCAHNHEGDELSNFKTLLSPRDQDYFYRSHFCVLNGSIFTDQLKFSRQDVICKRCLSVLGVLNKEDSSIKFWNYSFEFVLVPKLDDYHGKSSPLNDFKSALMSCVKNEFKEVHFLALEQERETILLVKPMEMNLNLLIESSNSINSGQVALENIRVTKVMYKYGILNSESRQNNDSDINICRIGLKSMTAGVEHLVSSSRRIPPIYRSIDDYNIGYVM